jgi:GDSL-like lipase/acylhydrolase family protein
VLPDVIPADAPQAGRIEPLPRWQRGLLVTLLLLINSALAFAIAEFGARTLRPGRPWLLGFSMSQALEASARMEVQVPAGANLFGMIAPSTHEGQVYELKPGRRWVFKGVEVTTDRSGCRCADWQAQRTLEKPEGARRVLVLGDSVAFGWGVPFDSLFTTRLEEQLNASSGVRRIEVFNCAVPSYNAAQEAALLEHVGLRMLPDLVLIAYTLNDDDPPEFSDPKGLAALIRWSRLLQLGHEVAEARWLGPLRVRGAFARVARLAAAGGFRVAVTVYPQTIPDADAELPRTEARSHGFAYVDLYGPFQDYYRAHGLKGIEDLYVAPGDPHPGAQGHRLMTESLRPALERLLN